MSVLSIKDLSAGYGKLPVIQDISLEAEPGQFIALIGPNGSGKSTLIKALAGLLKITSGEIWAGDVPLSFLEPRERARMISYLSQDRTAIPSMSVSDILELGRAPFRGRLGQISDKGRVAIDRAAQAADLTDFLTRKFGELSGGEQARVLLARALTVDAPIILADEPNAALDPYYQISTMKILKSEAQQGKTVITALHDLRLAARYADQVWVMDGGELVYKGVCHGPKYEALIGATFRVSLEQL